MGTLIALYIFIVFLMALFSKPVPGVLSCGIFGFNGIPKLSKEAYRSVMQKIKILGIYNQHRGRDSCGISVGDTILKGTFQTKDWDDFIRFCMLPTPSEEDTTVIGHVRAAANSKGGHTEENAHPFKIKDHLVGTHNGVIYNIDELLRKNDLNPNDFKVDSLGLYTLIENEGMEILSEYVGHAALAFKYLDDPNTLYLYHGASRTSKNSKLFEERPLFWMKTDQGIFYSSVSEGLEAIREDETNEPITLSYNTVFQVKDGDFTGWQFSVDREENNISIFSTKGNANQASLPLSQSSTVNGVIQGGNRSTSNSSGAGVGNKRHEHKVLRETLPNRAHANWKKNNVIYYHQGRHWVTPRLLPTGKLTLNKKGEIMANPEDGGKDWWFWEGVMLNGEDAYNKLLKVSEIKTSFLHNSEMNFAACMAKYAMYPVCNMDGQSSQFHDYHKCAWYHIDKRANGSSTPKFSTRDYTFDNGFLLSITDSANKTPVFFQDSKSAKLEVEMYLKGGKLLNADVEGGTSDEDPFPTSEITGAIPGSSPSLHSTAAKLTESSDNSTGFHETGESNDGEADWWYETKYKSLEEALREIGQLEVEALRKYVRMIMDKDNRTYNDKMVEMAVCDLIVTASNHKTSIMGLCENEEEKNVLVRMYEEVLDDNANGIVMEQGERFTEEKKKYTSESYVEEVAEAFSSVQTELDMSTANDVRATLEDQIDSAEGMLAKANALLEDQDSDLAQEMAASLFKNVSTIQGNLLPIADKYNYRDLSVRIKGLNRKDGIKAT